MLQLIVISNVDLFRLFQQENLARVASTGDNLMHLTGLDSDLFQRMGIFAAFDSWERAKKFVEFSLGKSLEDFLSL